MPIYLRSRGKSRDYTWLEPDSRSEKDPDKYVEILQALDVEYPSLVIFRYKKHSHEKRLILFISNCISAPARKDFQNRIIQDSLFWDVEDNPEYDRKIRAIAAAVLEDRNCLQQIFAKVIEFPIPEENEDSRGFDCKAGELEKELTNKFPPSSGIKSPFETKRWAKESEENKKELADELRSLEHLPGYEGFLVMVTGFKAGANLKNVWRAISRLVGSEKWSDSVADDHISNFPIEQQLPKIAMIGLAIVAVLCIAIISNSYTCGLQIQNTLNPQNPTLPDRCHYLQIPKFYPPQPTPKPASIEQLPTPKTLNPQDLQDLQYLLENLEPAQIKEAFDRLPPDRQTTLLNTLQEQTPAPIKPQ